MSSSPLLSRGGLFSRVAVGVPPCARGVGSHGPGVVKTKSAIKKRFRVRGNGAITRLQSGKRHLNLHKSSARITSLGASLWLRACDAPDSRASHPCGCAC